MLDPSSTRLVFKVEIEAAMPIHGTDQMHIVLRTGSVEPLTLRLTRPEAVELMTMILAERARFQVAKVDPSFETEPRKGNG